MDNNEEHRKWLEDRGDSVLRLNYELDKDSLVLDIGGYEGSWALSIHERYGCKVRVYEPVKNFFDNIEKRFRDVPNIEVFNFGVSSESGTTTIFVPEKGKDSTSLFINSGIEEKINIVSILELIPESGVDLIKLNVEGSEYDILDSLISNKLHLKVKNIQVQFHNVDTNSSERRDSIRKSLQVTHKETYCYPFIWENWELI